MQIEYGYGVRTEMLKGLSEEFIIELNKPYIRHVMRTSNHHLHTYRLTPDGLACKCGRMKPCE